MVRRRAVHRRRFHVLVRGHVPEQGPDQDRRRRSSSANGKPGRMVKVDETTVAFEFDEPHFLFPSQLAGDTQVGGGQSRLQSDERELGLYAPAHYLKQFLPKYSSVEA